MTQFRNFGIIISITVCFVLFAGCDLEPKSHTIVSPAAGITVYYGTSVTFVSTGSFNGVIWNSSLQGELGQGNSISAVLTKVGTHTITIVHTNKVYHSITINVIPLGTAVGTYFSYPLLGIDQRIPVSAGTYAPIGLSFSGSGKVLNISIDGNGTTISTDIPVLDTSEAPLRDHGLGFLSDFEGEPVKPPANGAKTILRTYELNQTKNFKVLRLTSSYPFTTTPHSVDAKLIYSSADYYFWLDKSITYSGDYNASMVDLIWQDLNTTALPRARSIWGDPGDIDSDGKISILLTDVLNESNIAVGFFNSADFSTWSSSNPTSNMMEVVYVGVPDNSNANFSRESIVATTAHELQHLILYYHKTYVPRSNTGTAPVETLYLNEGLSHLTENLCGYGVSGGNINFADTYLKNPAYYSLRYRDGSGRDAGTSNGIRGGMSLFLYWLFEKKGGATWESNGTITDNGGLAAIRTLARSSKIGWDAIEEVAGMTAEELLTEWAADIQAMQMGHKNKPASFTDPVTGEEISLHPFLGTVPLSNSTNLVLNGPARKSFVSNVGMLPYSVVFWSPFTVTGEKNITITESGDLDSAKLIFYRDQ